MAIVIGAGSHAMDIRNDMSSRFGMKEVNQVVTWVAHHSEYLGDRTDDIIIAVNDPRLRARIADELHIIDCLWVHENVYIGAGSIVNYGTHVNYGVTMTRTSIGHHCTISPGVTICGDVTIGDRVLVGAGATICDRVTIGSDATIGAGAVVLPETVIPNGETWVGIPAHHK